jgi:glutathione S-transferase
MYRLYIANKNYSSWSLRPWLLMRELAIPFGEHLVTFSEGSRLMASPCRELPASTAK